MGFDFSGLDITSLSTGTLVLMIVVSFMRGWIVPRSTLRDRTAAYEKEIGRVTDDGNDWRDSSLAKDAVIFELNRQNGELLEGTRTTNALLRALPKGGERRGRPDREAGESQR